MKIKHTDHDSEFQLSQPTFEGEVRAFSAFLWWPKRINLETRWLEEAHWIKTAIMKRTGYIVFLYWEESWSTHPYDTQTKAAQ